jgi:hypothetical protein
MSTTLLDQKPRMATEIPSAITVPDRLETRLGTLSFFDGFPDDATVEKVYDNLDFQRAVQACLTALPAASIHAMRTASRRFGPDNQTVLIFETLLESRSLYLTPNSESLYVFARLDLKDGPVVVESPPSTLGLVQDLSFYTPSAGWRQPDPACEMALSTQSSRPRLAKAPCRSGQAVVQDLRTIFQHSAVAMKRAKRFVHRSLMKSRDRAAETPDQCPAVASLIFASA